jgi:hypothetical protein
MPNKESIYNALGQSMREFGYPDCTNEIAAEILNAYFEGKRDDDLPHGVLGRMLEDQCKIVAESKELSAIVNSDK